MSTKFTKLNHRYAVIEFPLTFAELKEITKEIPKTERVFYEYSIKASSKYIKDNDKIYYLTVGGAKLLKPSGFVFVLENSLVLTYLKGGVFGGAEAEKVDFNSIKNVDFDLIPGGSSSYGGGILLLELTDGKKKKIRDIQPRDLDNLVDTIKNRVSLYKDSQKSPDLPEIFYGINASEKEKGIIRSHPLAAVRIANKQLTENERIQVTLPVKYDAPKGKKVKGLLVATNKKIVFVSETIFKTIIETWSYEEINKVEKNDSELRIQGDNGDFLFEFEQDHLHNAVKIEDIFQTILNPPTEEIINIENEDVYEDHTEAPAVPTEKYQQLKQIAELRDQGILTDEEFQNEKVKILNQ